MDSLPHPSRLSPRFLSRSNSAQDINGNMNGNGETLKVPNSNPPPVPQESWLSEQVEKCRESMRDLATLLQAIKRPLPEQTGDGTYLPKEENDSLVEQCKDVVTDLGRLGIKDICDLAEVFSKAKFNEPLDDRDYLMEKLIQAAAKLPDRGIGRDITDAFLTTLYKDLEHPPKTLLGEEYHFRMPDGSKNNCYLPDVGKAGAPYARTVPSRTKQPGALPDPGVLFDSLLARKKPEPHPTRISSMLFNLASIIIHDIFRTDHKDYRKSKTSSYLDLAPLYGSNWEEQKRMRTMKDGKIKPDCFSETRLLSFPPGVGALLIMFNRYHNYIVGQLAVINQDNRFSDAEATIDRYGETALNKRDDDLFQTARLVTCGLYVNIILIDYVRTILNLNRTDSNWQLNPRAEIPNGPEQATGNQVSAEFNLVYRWHAAISDRDDKWTQELLKELWPGKDWTSMTEIEIVKDLGHLERDLTELDPLDRPFPLPKRETLHRQTEGPHEGMFKDDDLAAIISSSIEDCANAYGPQQIPVVMRAIEILGIQQARSWNMATLNEFRKHFALTPHKTFEDITRNMEVAEALKNLYDTPDNVELYPGLIVEDAKVPMVPGAGLCPGYTISRGVLSDAVALVRGDRFFTTSYTPNSLTNFGFQEASSDVSIDNGCVFYKLLLRGLPNNYDPQSVYVHYPLTIPSEMEKVLVGLNKAHKYDFSTPTPKRTQALLFGYDTAKRVLDDQETFKVFWDKAMKFLMGPKGANFALAGDAPVNAASRERMEEAIYLSSPPEHPSRQIPTGHEEWIKEVRSFYANKTQELLREKSYRLGQLNQVDIVRDVANLVHVHFVSAMFSLPLKTEEHPRGIFTEHELYLIISAVFITIFFDVDPTKSFPLRQQAYEATQKLGQIVQFQVAAVMKTGKFGAELWEAANPPSPFLGSYGIHLIQRLCNGSDKDVADLVWGNLMGTIGGMVSNQGQLWSQAFDWFMSTSEGREHFKVVADLAKQDTDEADDKILHYFLEAARLNGESGVLRNVEKDVTIEDKNGEYQRTWHLKAGDTVMVDLKAASRDPGAFENPDELDLNRPVESYIMFGWGPHHCLGLPMTQTALATVLKVVAAQLDNVVPATMAVGKTKEESEVKKIIQEFFPGSLQILPKSWHYHGFLTEDWDMQLPFPSSLKVNWDGPGFGSSPNDGSSGNTRS